MNDTILLTGATSPIGVALTARLLLAPGNQVVALLRASDAGRLAARRRQLIGLLGADPGARLGVVQGDVSQPQLGLSRADQDRVLAEVDSVMHCAVPGRFAAPADATVAAGVDGAREAIELALLLLDRGRLRRFDHLSGTGVAGDRTGTCFEDECDVGQAFRSPYEASACQAEELVRAAMTQGLPACIHRPSIVVDDRPVGGPARADALHRLLQLHGRGWWRTVPGSPDALCDVVPVSFVAQAIAALRADPASIGATVHLAAGPDAPRALDLATALAAELGVRPARFVDQDRLRQRLGPTLMTLDRSQRLGAWRRRCAAVLPYLQQNPRFDTAVAQALLPLSLRPPPVAEVLARIARQPLRH